MLLTIIEHLLQEVVNLIMSDIVHCGNDILLSSNDLSSKL